MECDRVDAIIVFLCNYGTKRISGCVGVHNKRFCPVRGFQHGFQRTDFLQMLEGAFTFVCPIPLAIFACQVVQGLRDIGKVRDEGPVEVTEAEEAAHILDVGGSRPLGDPFNFDWIHTHFSISDDHSEIFDFALMELAFAWLEE